MASPPLLALFRSVALCLVSFVSSQRPSYCCMAPAPPSKRIEAVPMNHCRAVLRFQEFHRFLQEPVNVSEGIAHNSLHLPCSSVRVWGSDHCFVEADISTFHCNELKVGSWGARVTMGHVYHCWLSTSSIGQCAKKSCQKPCLTTTGLLHHTMQEGFLEYSSNW